MSSRDRTARQKSPLSTTRTAKTDRTQRKESTRRESVAGKVRRRSVVIVKLDKLPEGVTEDEVNDSDWTWTTATPSPVETIPAQEEIWEAVEDNDSWDTDLICEEGSVDVNHKYHMERGRTLLSLAAELGHVKVLNTLLWHHADPNIPDNDGRTPLIEAAEKGHSEVVRFLLDAHVSLNDQDIINHRTALMYAARHGFEAITSSLLACKPSLELTTKGGWTALFFAVRWGHVNVAAQLISAGANIDVVDLSGRTPLMYAVRRGDDLMTELLLSRTPNVTHRSVNGWNALMYATLRGNSDVVLTLIGHGATINDENDDGDTVLAIACKCQQRDIVEYLLGYGAKPTRKEATILMENNNLEILQLFTLAPVTDVSVSAVPVQREDTSASVIVSWKCPYLTGKPHVDMVDKFIVTSVPDVGRFKVLSNTFQVEFTGLRFDEEYQFDVMAKGCKLKAPATRSRGILIQCHVATWLKKFGLFEAAFGPVMAYLEACGRDNTTTVSRMTKTLKDEHVVAMGLDHDTEARLRQVLETTTREILIEESAPLQIRKADVEVEVWSGLNRRGVWKGGRIVVRKFSKKDVTAARLEEMLRDTVLFSEIDHPNIARVRGCTVEPDLGFGFEMLEDAVSLADWCAMHPSIDDIDDLSELALSVGVRCRIVLEIALGMLELKRHEVLHGDLRPTNTYLHRQANGVVLTKISEYNLVRPKFRFDRDRPDMKVIDAPPPRLPEYTAPEQLIDERQVTYSSDVYSLAILFVEVLSGKRGLVWEGAPASSRSSFLFKQWIKTAAIAGIRPEIPVATPEAVKVIIQFAWTRHPEERSTLEQFRDSLEAVTARVHDLSGLTTTVIDLP